VNNFIRPRAASRRGAHSAAPLPRVMAGYPPGLRSRAFPGLLISDRGSTPPDYRCADKVSRRTRRRGRSRLLTSARTARRTFDLQLAIATLRLPAPASRLERIRTIPVVYGGNRAVLFEKSPAGRGGRLAHAPAPIDRHMKPAAAGLTGGASQSHAGAIAVSPADRLWPHESRPRAGWRPIAAGRQVSRSTS
jgi:hypothetical protein